MEPQKIYESLNRMAELKEELKNKKPVFGDKKMIEYNHCVISLYNLSAHDLSRYNRYLSIKHQETFIPIEKKLEELLDFKNDTIKPQLYLIKNKK